MLDRLPRPLLRLEGAALAAGALVLYFHLDYHDGRGWLLLVALALAPDLSLLGYLAGQRVGAVTYDVGHTTTLPVGLGLAGVLFGAELAVQIALVWLTHIGVDRAVGYGLKYPESFKETHLQRV